MNTILLTTSEDIATITLNRPENGNAINMELAAALAEAAAAVAADPAIRCVLLKGAGRMFCVGGDVTAFADAGSGAGSLLRLLADKLHEAVSTLSEMEKPLVTCVHGAAAGAGMGLALLGDRVLLGESAHFTAAYTAIGLTPDGGMSWLLPRLVGARRALDILMSNRRISASEALDLSLVSRVIPDGELDAAAGTDARGLASGPVAAYATCRKLVLHSGHRALADHLRDEAAQIAAAADGAEGREGISAFAARRKPAFRDSNRGEAPT